LSLIAVSERFDLVHFFGDEPDVEHSTSFQLKDTGRSRRRARFTAERRDVRFVTG
jgi:hypothetical protein